MRSHSTWRSRAAMAVLVVASAACVVLFLPANLGGAATYMTTHGNSMEPKFHTGDLAIVKPVNSYRVGDIAVYQSRTLHTLVMHRIVGREGNHYVFKGDHNSWTDKDRPTRADLVGKLWLEVPHGGAALDVVHRYWMFILPRRPAAALRHLRLRGAPPSPAAPRDAQPRRQRFPVTRRRSVASTAHAGAARRSTKTARVHTARDGRAIDADPGPSIRATRPGGGATGTRRRARRRAATRRGSKRMRRLGAIQLVSGTVLVFCLVGGAFAWSHSPTDVGITPVAYRNQGAFTYTAPVPEGPVYGTRGLQTGDPVYLRLVSQLDVGFAYHLLTGAPHRRVGNCRAARRRERRDRLARDHRADSRDRLPERRGPAARDARPHDRSRPRSTAASGATGVHSTTATVAVVGDVHVSGRVDGRSFTDQFAPKLTFELDPLVMRLTEASAPTSSTGSSSVSIRPAREPRRGHARARSARDDRHLRARRRRRRSRAGRRSAARC